MNSIKKKLFAQIGTLIVIMICFLMLANTLLLKTYYTYNLKNKLIDYYTTINLLKTSDYENSIVNFATMETTSNVDILIRDDHGTTLYTSKPMDPLMNKPPKRPDDVIKTTKINDKVRFIWGKDPQLRHENLSLKGRLDNGNIIELRLPLAPIEENIKLSNDFLLIIGLIVFVLAMIFTYMLANYFTKPIREMNEATKNIKKLDFKTSCKVISNDEIGQLAESINEMSLILSNTISNLNIKNLQLENEIDEKNKIDEKRRVLLNNVSHELKTPLGLMQGYAEGLKLNVAKNKEKSDFYCEVIIDEAIKMNQLVESLLGLNQIEFGDQNLYKSEFEVNEFVLQTLNKYIEIFEDQNVKWKLNNIEPVKGFADFFMLERVLTNYITNAINYVDENLSVEITIVKLEKRIRIEVFNTAEPIKEEEIDRIWDSFYKVDKARTREKGGHGLGLSIVKAIQEAHNEGYGVKNTDKGVCFWFDIHRQ